MSLPHDQTAEAVICAFNSLPDDEKRLFVSDFFKAIPPTPEYLVKLFNKASAVDKDEFLRRIWDSLTTYMSAERIHATMDRVVVPQVEEILRKNKQARDRKPDPATAVRDAEIHRLRTEDKKKWSWKKLGNKFGITGPAARLAFLRHAERTNSG
jgi:hypothetical protein